MRMGGEGSRVRNETGYFLVGFSVEVIMEKGMVRAAQGSGGK